MTKWSWLRHCRQHVDEATELVRALARLVRALTLLTSSAFALVTMVSLTLR